MESNLTCILLSKTSAKARSEYDQKMPQQTNVTQRRRRWRKGTQRHKAKRQ